MHMTVIAQKAEKTLILKGEFILGILIFIAAVIVLPVVVFSIEEGLIREPLLWGVVIVTALFFAGGSFLMLIRPYLHYRRLPVVQAETDGTYLYIHSKKEAKLPLEDMEGTSVFATPENLVIQLLADGYGRVDITLADGEKHKLYFISHANQVPNKIASLIESRLSD